MWFVIQVKAGDEDKVIALLERHLEDGVLAECFTPRYEAMFRFRGRWEKREKPLIPGYVIAVTDNINGVNKTLRTVPAFTRILGNDAGFTPLTKQDISWIQALTEPEKRTVEMSEGFIEGDEIIITKGPLMNHTGWIESINRHKRLAFLSIEMFGRKIKTRVGLGILWRHPAKH